MKLVKTRHYIDNYEKNFPIEDVERIVNTTKGKRIGKNLIKYERMTKKRIIYVLCSIDKKRDELKIINAKKIDKRLL